MLSPNILAAAALCQEHGETKSLLISMVMTSYCSCHFLFSWAICDAHSSRVSAHASFQPCSMWAVCDRQSLWQWEKWGEEKGVRILYLSKMSHHHGSVSVKSPGSSPLVSFASHIWTEQQWMSFRADKQYCNTLEHKWIRAADAYGTYLLQWKSLRLSMLLQRVRLAITRANSVDIHQFCSPCVWCLPPLQLSTCWLHVYIFPTPALISHNLFLSQLFLLSVNCSIQVLLLHCA